MTSSEFGKFNGNSWEAFCQKCFKLKYEGERYQEIPADTRGDLGIEGFTSTGKVFQCYCPDNEPNTRELHSLQTTKINNDLKKLIKNCEQLQKYLAGVKIKEWIFVTPQYRNKELIRYCKEKAEVYKNKGLSIIHEDFDILVYNDAYFIKEAAIVLDRMDQKINIQRKTEVSSEDVTAWSEANIDLTNNAIRKLGNVVKPLDISKTSRVNSLVDVAVKEYLNGIDILEKWRQLFPEKYESFLALIARLESQLVETTTLNIEGNRELYRKVQENLMEVIKSEFPNLKLSVQKAIANKIFYGWLLECHLDFE